MSELLTAMRRVESKKTPKWARTADGIVRRWQEEERHTRSLLALRLSDRLQRLFVIGCCRAAGIEDEDTNRHGKSPIREALDAAERMADGGKPEGRLVDLGEALGSNLTTRSRFARVFARLAGVRLALLDICGRGSKRENAEIDDGLTTCLVTLAGLRAGQDRRKSARRLPRAGSTRNRRHLAEVAQTAARAIQGQLLAGIVGPDWHLAPAWRTDTAVQLARGIYDRREFSAMPILADALQDAGCDNEPWLAKMRDPNWPWCRGCHVIDSLLPELVHTGG